MRILIATDTYYPHANGASVFTQRLAEGLNKKGHEILVVAPSKTITNSFYRHNNVRIFGARSLPVVIKKNLRYSPPVLSRRPLKKVIKEFQPELVHIQDHFSIGKSSFLEAKKLHLPTIGTNHFTPENLLRNVPYFTPLPSEAKFYARSFAWKGFRKVYEKLDVITTPTKSAVRFMRKQGFKKKVIPISNGIDTKKFSPKNNGEYLRKKFKIPNRPTLLYVGRLDQEKNLDVALTAFSLIPNFERFHFVIAGIGICEKSLKRLARDLGITKSATFCGFIKDKDLPNLYTTANCFIIASSVELQSLVTLEALASGLPIIAAKGLALPELVSQGKNGYLFNTNDIEGLAQSLQKILSNKKLQVKMSKESLAIAKKHNINKTIEAYEKLYSQLLNKKLKSNSKRTPGIPIRLMASRGHLRTL
ncbi:MAG: glycosyltransferase [bacterium]|nr:glycosyltransferase [bacterium]